VLLKGTDGNGKRWKQDREQIWKCGNNMEMWKCMQGKDVCARLAKEKMEYMERRKHGNREQMEIYMCTTEVPQLYNC
jgi:hypothetical protein